MIFDLKVSKISSEFRLFKWFIYEIIQLALICTGWDNLWRIIQDSWYKRFFLPFGFTLIQINWFGIAFWSSKVTSVKKIMTKLTEVDGEDEFNVLMTSYWWQAIEAVTLFRNGIKWCFAGKIIKEMLRLTFCWEDDWVWHKLVVRFQPVPSLLVLIVMLLKTINDFDILKDDSTQTMTRRWTVKIVENLEKSPDSSTKTRVSTSARQ